MKLPVPTRSLMVFLSKLKVFWREWDVQTMVLTSFAMQLILILVAPFRKRTSNQIVVVSIWMAYLLADWVAAQGIGLIARPCGSMTFVEVGSAELYAFWGQFLLLHLGGPDTITALALEDNELWLRTGLHLGVQVYGSLGVLIKSIAQYGSNLWVPTILMFMAGILKYLERVTSLFHGRLVKLCDRQHSKSNSSPIPELPHKVFYEQLTNVEQVITAYYLFHCFKGLYMDKWIPTQYRGESRGYFSKTLSFEEAFRQVEMQLNFAYEAFYTKMVIVHSSRSWKVLRYLVASLLVGCLAIWVFFTNKQGFLHYDVQITYTLLIGAIIAELLAFVRIQLSDWTIAKVDESSRIRKMFYNRFLSAYQKCTWERYWRKEDPPTWPYLRRLFFRRWSESISQLNMISMCMAKPRPHTVQKAIDFFGLKDALDKRKYVSHKWFSNQLKSFIFEDIKRLASIEDPKPVANMGYTKGSMAFRCLTGKTEVDSHEDKVDIGGSNTSKIFPITLKLFNIHWRYDVILVRWHIITEFCYVTHDESKGRNTNTKKQLDEDYLKVEHYREICKTLSDYLFSLLIYQPEMMSAVTNTEDTSRKVEATLKETKKDVSQCIRSCEPKSMNEQRRMFCWYLWKKFNIEVFQPQISTIGQSTRDILNHIELPIDEIKSELEELEKAEGELAKWKLIAEVWAELLYYAALRCKPTLHAAKLKQGGELLSLVWMLLFQSGIGLKEGRNSMERLADTIGTDPMEASLHLPF